MNLPLVMAATDGACRGNPGPGGWGVVLRWAEVERELSGAEPLTTNNRMEMTAALRALASLTRPARVTLVTDSRYLVDGITRWRPGWERRGWRLADGRPVKNEDLWRALVEAAGPHDVRWQWVRGHAGHPDNERADRLAVAAVDTLTGGAAERRCAEPSTAARGWPRR